MRGSIQKRGMGSWRLIFDLERGFDGNRRQKVVSFKGNKRDAERELSRLITELENGGFADPHSLTLAEYLDRWLDKHAATSTAPKTLERYQEICRNHVVPSLGVMSRPMLKSAR